METVKRGYMPKNTIEFGPKAKVKLNAALEERERKRLREAPHSLVLDGFNTIITFDAIILDKCGSWHNLNRDLIKEAIPEAWVFRLNRYEKERDWQC